MRKHCQAHPCSSNYQSLPPHLLPGNLLHLVDDHAHRPKGRLRHPRLRQHRLQHLAAAHAQAHVRLAQAQAAEEGDDGGQQLRLRLDACRREEWSNKAGLEPAWGAREPRRLRQLVTGPFRKLRHSREQAAKLA
jgi:hypothetical protein